MVSQRLSDCGLQYRPSPVHLPPPHPTLHPAPFRLGRIRNQKRRPGNANFLKRFCGIRMTFPSPGSPEREMFVIGRGLLAVGYAALLFARPGPDPWQLGAPGHLAGTRGGVGGAESHAPLQQPTGGGGRGARAGRTPGGADAARFNSKNALLVWAAAVS